MVWLSMQDPFLCVWSTWLSITGFRHQCLDGMVMDYRTLSSVVRRCGYQFQQLNHFVSEILLSLTRSLAIGFGGVVVDFTTSSTVVGKYRYWFQDIVLCVWVVWLSITIPRPLCFSNTVIGMRWNYGMSYVLLILKYSNISLVLDPLIYSKIVWRPIQ